MKEVTRRAPATKTAPAERPVRQAVRLFPSLHHPNARGQRAFLIAYSRTGNVTRAAAAARVDRSSHKHWLDYEGSAGQAYREAFAAAQEMAADLLEQEARRRAVDGLVRFRFDRSGEPLIHPKTGQPYYELEYSDTLLIALLRAKREEFRERSIDLKHSGAVGLVALTAEQAKRLDDADLLDIRRIAAKVRGELPDGEPTSDA